MISEDYDFLVLAGARQYGSVLHVHLHYATALHHVRDAVFVDHLDCS